MSKLDDEVFESHIWKKVKRHFDDRLESLRQTNDARMNEDDTSHIRGRIAEIKYLLALDNPAPVINEDEPG